MLLMTQSPPSHRTGRTPFTKERLLQEPWIPITAFATAGVCVLGVRQFFAGNSRQSQTFMRLRVFFQGLTIFGIGMSMWSANKPK